jgi:hypothetical protein
VRDNLRYVAYHGCDKAELGNCTALAELVRASLSIRDSLSKDAASTLVYELLVDVTTSQRILAFNAGSPSIAAGRALNVHDGKKPFQIAAISEVLGFTDETTFRRVREVLHVDEAKWRALILKEKAAHGDGRKCLRQLRGRLWCGERTKGDYSSKLVREREEDLLKALEEAINNYLSDKNIRQSLAAYVPEPVEASSGQLVTTSGTAVRAQVVSLEVHSSSTDYVHRDEIERQFQDFVARRVKVIALVGFPGMGKTTIARALTADYPMIRFDNGVPQAVDIQAALDQYCADRGIIVTPENMASALGVLLRTERGPGLVLLDGIHHPRELGNVVPNDPVAKLVVTCREYSGVRRGSTNDTEVASINVDIMSEDEASRLVSQFLPSLDKDMTSFVATTLGRYPLAIEAACSLALTPGVNVRELCIALNASPGTIRVRKDELLHDILKRHIEYLAERDGGLSVLLLAYLASCDFEFFAQHPDDLRLLVDLLDDVSAAEFAESLQAILKLSLVKLELHPHIAKYKKDPTANQRRVKLMESYFLAMHPLVKSMLREILHEVVLLIDTELYVVLVDLVTDAYVAFKDDRAAFWDMSDLHSKIFHASQLLNRGQTSLNVRGLPKRLRKLAKESGKTGPGDYLRFLLNDSYDREDGDDRHISVVIGMRTLHRHLEANRGLFEMMDEYERGWTTDETAENVPSFNDFLRQRQSGEGDSVT